MSSFIGRYENDKENKCREELFFYLALFLIFSSGCSLTLQNLPTTSTLTEPGFCLESCPLTEHYPGADLLSLPSPPEKPPNSFTALGLWIKRQELECWLLQKWQCHHLNVTSGAQQAVGVSLSESGRETVSLKCGVLSIVMLRLWECVCMFGMTSSLITV